jgi:hypothetical protein
VVIWIVGAHQKTPHPRSAAQLSKIAPRGGDRPNSTCPLPTQATRPTEAPHPPAGPGSCWPATLQETTVDDVTLIGLDQVGPAAVVSVGGLMLAL